MRRARSGSSALASPKSSTFTVAVGAHLDVGGLEIAVDDALLVRGFERLGDLPRDRQRLVERASVRARCAATDPRPRPAPSPAPGRRRRLRSRRSCAMFGWFSAASVCASRLNRASRSGSLANDIGQHLDRDVAVRASCRARDRPRPCRRRRGGRAPRTVRCGRRPQSPFRIWRTILDPDGTVLAGASAALCMPV